jgi:hypothetical protein
MSSNNCACSIIAQQVAGFAIAMGSESAFKAARVIAERIESGLGPFTDEEIAMIHDMVGADPAELPNPVINYKQIS